MYLLCGAFRLARFNCLATMSGTGGGKDFLGFPIPAAAGLVSSLTLLIIKLNEKEKTLGNWKFLLAVVLVFLSAMMVSKVRYPSFKMLGLRSKSSFAKAILAASFLGLILVYQEKILIYVLPAFFTAYLLYGFVRPWLSRAWREEIEEEDDDEFEEGPTSGK
jgi:CDP-diacylglycerol--serine O-phosphatidyltransferase